MKAGDTDCTPGYYGKGNCKETGVSAYQDFRRWGTDRNRTGGRGRIQGIPHQ